MANPKKRKKGKIIIPIVMVILLIVVVSTTRRTNNAVSFYTEEAVARRDIVNYYAFSGNVETINNTTVLAEVSQKVLQVNVEVGDAIKAGDTIAVLDSSEIEQRIESKKISMSSAEVSDSYNINSAKNTYEDYKAGIENGTNNQLVSAQSTLDNALSKLESAEKEYEKAKETVENQTDSSLLSAQQSLESAERKLESAKKEYEVRLEEYNNQTDSSLLSARQSLESAGRKLESAKKEYENYLKENEIGTNASLLSAQQSVDAARRKLESAENTYRDYLDQYEGYEEEYFETSLEQVIEDIDKARALRDETKAAWNQAKEAYRLEMEVYVAAIEEGNGSAEEEKINNLADLVSETEQIYYEAQYEYSDAMSLLTDIDAKLYDTIVSYRNSYLSAKDSYDSAVRSLTDAQESLDKNLTSYYDRYLSAQESYNSAERSLTDTEANLKKNLDSSYESYLTAQESYKTAERNLADTESGVDSNLENCYERYVAAKDEYEDAKENYASTELSVNQTLQSYKDSYDKTVKLVELSTASLELADLYEQLENCTIKAIADGIVSELNISEGNYASANQSAAVITDFSEMKLSIEINEYDLAKIKEGDVVEVHINATGDILDGTIDTISLSAEISGGVAYFSADVRFEAGENVRPGMSAEVKLISQKALQTTSVPVEALNYEENNVAYVFVKNTEGQPEKRNVTLGVSDGTYIEITDGLEESEIVLYIPSTNFNSFGAMRNFGGGAS